MKKELLIILFIIIVSGCTQQQEPEETEISNPSAVYCVEQGYVYDIRTDTTGGQRGYCIFSDGSECEGWGFYRGECTVETALSCRNLCGDKTCQEVVCQAIGCPCPESINSCPSDCSS